MRCNSITDVKLFSNITQQIVMSTRLGESCKAMESSMCYTDNLVLRTEFNLFYFDMILQFIKLLSRSLS